MSLIYVYTNSQHLSQFEVGTDTISKDPIQV